MTNLKPYTDINPDKGYIYVPYVFKTVKTDINGETVWYANKFKNLLLKIKRFFFKPKFNKDIYLNKPINKSYYQTIDIIRNTSLKK